MIAYLHARHNPNCSVYSMREAIYWLSEKNLSKCIYIYSQSGTMAVQYRRRKMETRTIHSSYRGTSHIRFITPGSRSLSPGLLVIFLLPFVTVCYDHPPLFQQSRRTKKKQLKMLRSRRRKKQKKKKTSLRRERDR